MGRKGGRGGGFKGMGGGMPNMQGLMKQAQKMQKQMEEKQEEVAKSTFESTAGGGAVSIKMTGDYQITELKIDPEVLEDGDAEMLEDMITTAVNDATSQAKKASDEVMEAMGGGGGLPFGM